MNEQINFDTHGLPPVCHACGAGGLLTPYKTTYQHNSASWLSVLALLVGLIYYQEMIYTVHLPLCPPCVRHRRRRKPVLWLMWFGVAVVIMFAASRAESLAGFLILLAVLLVAATVYTVILQRKGQPKAARINNDLLVVRVPGYGEVTLFERHAAPGAQAGRPAAPRQPSGPRLSRSVCGECGFINFAGAAECKKCRAPLGAAEAAGVGWGG